MMKSEYGDRETVGTQYLEAQNNDVANLTIADINREIVGNLVEELNNSIASDPFDGEEFFINVVEERDLLMKNAFKRRMFVQKFRPYPEDNTLVFRVDPKESRVFYCWDLPHHSELPNILINAHLYDQDYIRSIKQWLNNDLTSFGFTKVHMNSSLVEGYSEKLINNYRENYYNYCKSLEMDEKSVEVERRMGYFWIPNVYAQDKEMNPSKPKFTLIGV